VLDTTANQVAIIGRIDSADVFKNGKAVWPSGYILQVGADGAWTLISGSYQNPPQTLTSGKVESGKGVWHRLALEFRAQNIAAFIDGKRIASVQDSSHKAGMFGLGTDWGRAQFDNLTVGR